jgi:siderophore synthetase component
MKNHAIIPDDKDHQILSYLKTHQTFDQEDYIHQILPARLSILDKLLNALVRERLIPAGNITFRPQLLIIQLRQHTLIAPIQSGCGFERFTLQDFPALWNRTDNTMTTVLSPETLLDECLEKHPSYTNADCFREELRESAANLALSMAMTHLNKQPLLQDDKYNNIAACFDNKKWQIPAFTFSEQLHANGHPLHPSAKIRTGFTMEDIFRYTPEAATPVTIKWVLVHHSLLRMATTDDTFPASSFMATVFPDAWKQLIITHHQKMDNYIAVPVHEWQYNNNLREIYKAEIDNEQLLLPADIFATTGNPGISVRTLIVNGPLLQQCGQLKVSVRVQLTGYKRTITPQTALNGPAISRCLQLIRQRDAIFFECYPAAFLQEYCGGCFRHTDEEKATNLSFLWREDPCAHLLPGQHILVSAFLVAASPLTTSSVMQDYILHFAQQQNIPVVIAPLRWWNAYLQCVLPPILLMLTKYGIGMESHGQNVLVIFEAIYRDWGGMRIYLPRLRRYELSLTPEPDSVTNVSAIEKSHNKVVHAALQVHIGEMVRMMSIENNIAPHLLWEAVSNTICQTYQHMATYYPELAGQIADDITALTAPIVSCKSLVLMQLTGARKESYFNCENPLYSHTQHTDKNKAPYSMTTG